MIFRTLMHIFQQREWGYWGVSICDTLPQSVQKRAICKMDFKAPVSYTNATQPSVGSGRYQSVYETGGYNTSLEHFYDGSVGS